MATTATLTYWGPYLVQRDSNDDLQILGHPNDPDPSPIGQSLKQSQQCRVARPAIRRSWLRDGPGANVGARGHDPFVEVEWDEALDLVGAELARVRDEHGHASIFAGSYGWGSTGRFHMPSAQLFRFIRQFGGCTDVWGTYSSSGAEAIVPYIFGGRFHGIQRAQTSWSVIAEHTELFVSFGGLRLTNAQVSYNGQGPHQTRGWMQRACARQLEFLNISPLRDDIAAEFQPRWIHPHPGTDVALMAALIHSLVAANRHDQSFLQSHCHGWESLRQYVMGEADGVAKSAEWAATITGLSAQSIRDLAIEMASKRTCINVTYALQRQDHGEQAYWMAAALSAALGQIGLPGGGFIFPFGSAGFPGNGQANARVPGLPIPARPDGSPTISVSRIVDLLEASAGDVMQHNGREQQLPDTRLIYWCGGNVFHHHQDINRVNKAWQRPETIIVHEPFWTPMAKRADIVLPTTTPLERTDLGAAETLLLAMQPALAPYEDARDDYAILCGVAKRLGFEQQFSEGRSATQWVEHLYEKFRADSNDIPPYAEFVEQGTLEHDMPPMGTPRQVFLEEFRADPQAHPLETPSGLIELYSETIAAFGYDDCPPHPVWMEPFERLGSEASETYPMHLVSNQPEGRLHSQYDHGEVSQAGKIDGREVCKINPVDAAERGIQSGDVVKLFNARGACLAAARVSADVMPSAVQLSTGAWYDPDENGICKHGNPNVLTRDKGTSKLAQGPSAHTCLVQIKKFEGTPPAITAFDPPAFAARN